MCACAYAVACVYRSGERGSQLSQTLESVLAIEPASVDTASPAVSILFEANILLYIYRILGFYFILWNWFRRILTFGLGGILIFSLKYS